MEGRTHVKHILFFSAIVVVLFLQHTQISRHTITFPLQMFNGLNRSSYIGYKYLCDSWSSSSAFKESS
jgi:hypothetical protein